MIRSESVGAAGLLRRLGDQTAELCPHPAAREMAAIMVQGKGRPFVCCRTCYSTLGATIRAWHAYSIRPATVYRRLRMLEYSRRDALRFVLQLVADRASVRLGLRPRSSVDV